MRTRPAATVASLQPRRSFLKLCHGAFLALVARAASAQTPAPVSPPEIDTKTMKPTPAPQLFSLPENVVTRWASPENPTGRKGAGALTMQGRKGRPALQIKRGAQVVLAEATGSSGIIRRIWMTSHDRFPSILRGVRLDIYWDGAKTPGVSAPLGDFFGQGLGRMQTFESAFFSSPAGNSFNCVLPMPFQTGFRMVLTNESPVDLRSIFYDVNFTLGDAIESPSYLHAHWRREDPTTLRRDFEVLPNVVGRGRYLGANFSVIADRKTYFQSWWGEGECKMFLDGDGEHPTLVGTGTEDYVGSAWGLGKFVHLNQGAPIVDAEHGQYAFYRYHAPDPVYFSQNIRVVFQQIGGGTAKEIHEMRDSGLTLESAGLQTGTPVNMSLPDGAFVLYERQDDWSSCCYFYLDRPENGLPPLAPAEERTRGLLADKPG